MKAERRQFAGFTLPEAVTVVAIIAVLIGLSIPSIRAIKSSFQSTGARNMISAALASARAVAAQHQRYAGVRFQSDPNGYQYIIPIIQDTRIMAYGFRAIEGRKPIKLPENLGVMDLTIVIDRNWRRNPVNSEQIRLYQSPLTDAEKDNWLRLVDPNGNPALTDISAFSLIFSPSGKLVIHGVRIRNKDGQTNNSSNDDIFNTVFNVEERGIGMFYQDDYFDDDYFAPFNLGLGPEPSRGSFFIYDKSVFKRVDPARRWSDYLSRLLPVSINPYTGTIIE